MGYSLGAGFGSLMPRRLQVLQVNNGVTAGSFGWPNFAQMPPSATICPYLGVQFASEGVLPPMSTPSESARNSSRIALVTDLGTSILSSLNTANERNSSRPPNTQAAAPPEQPKPPKKPRVAARARNVAPSKARSGHKATPATKATKRDTSAKSPRRKAPCA
jgi:hypothetical protein